MNLPIPIPALLKVTGAIVAAMTGNAFFPNAAALLTAVGNAQKALDTAETATKTRAIGTVAARNAARSDLLSQIHAARALVQSAADADPAHAEAMITSAGMAVRKPTTHTTAPFNATQGPTSGPFVPVANAARRRASYDWQWSPDGGKTWTELPLTLQAKTTVAGIRCGHERAVPLSFGDEGGGQGDWSQPAALLVK